MVVKAHTSRRTLQDCLLCLMVGVCTTIIIAWACALQSEVINEPARQFVPWPAMVTEDWPVRCYSSKRYRGLGLWQEYAWGKDSPQAEVSYRLTRTDSGWPFPAMRVVLRSAGPTFDPDRDDRGPDNRDRLEAGVVVPLHHTRPHVGGDDMWCTRRLPILPIPLGFAANTTLAATAAMLLLGVWRLQPSSRRRHRVRWALCLCAAGLGINVCISWALWALWQTGPNPRQLHSESFRPGASVAQNATSLPRFLALWPATVGADWPERPEWIGWSGERQGVRVYEFTTKGVPSAAIEWIHVWWAGEAFSDHQQMLVTQVGWPLPTLQAEELFEEMPFRREASQSPPIAELSPSTFPGFPAQLDRYGAVWNLTLPGAPPARTAHDPSPIIPIRPLALGFIANSALFATGVAVVLLIPGALRTLIRRRRNACLACGYRLDQLSRCPECGVSAGGSDASPV